MADFLTKTVFKLMFVFNQRLKKSFLNKEEER